MLQKQEPRERCFFPAPMLDIAHAFLMIEDMASANPICMDKLALCGFSAGGHNAAMYATHLEDEVLLAAIAPRRPVRPAACILGYPISDYILMSEQAEDNPITRSLFMGNAITSFGTEHPSTEQLLSASPARLVSDSTPPMFLWATYEDALVPVIQTVKMASAMALKGRPFELHIFEQGPHGLSLADYVTAYSVADINPEAREWLPMCKRWLEQRFAPPLARKGKWV
jgi:acetyl esterase/lipase